MAKSWPAKNKYRHAMTKSNLAINMERGHGMHKLSLMEPMDGLEIAKTAKIGTEKQ